VDVHLPHQFNPPCRRIDKALAALETAGEILKTREHAYAAMPERHGVLGHQSAARIVIGMHAVEPGELRVERDDREDRRVGQLEFGVQQRHRAIDAVLGEGAHHLFLAHRRIAGIDHQRRIAMRLGPKLHRLRDFREDRAGEGGQDTADNVVAAGLQRPRRIVARVAQFLRHAPHQRINFRRYLVEIVENIGHRRRGNPGDFRHILDGRAPAPRHLCSTSLPPSVDEVRSAAKRLADYDENCLDSPYSTSLIYLHD